MKTISKNKTQSGYTITIKIHSESERIRGKSKGFQATISKGDKKSTTGFFNTAEEAGKGALSQIPREGTAILEEIMNFTLSNFVASTVKEKE